MKEYTAPATSLQVHVIGADNERCNMPRKERKEGVDFGSLYITAVLRQAMDDIREILKGHQVAGIWGEESKPPTQ